MEPSFSPGASGSARCDLEWVALEHPRSGAFCLTCQHFRYEVGKPGVTVLTCPIHQGLIPRAST